jgi:hypothetical protein
MGASLKAVDRWVGVIVWNPGLRNIAGIDLGSSVINPHAEKNPRARCFRRRLSQSV